MLISFSWLKELLPNLPSPAKLSEVLLSAGLEVERVERLEPSFSGVRVGEVLNLDSHPREPSLYLVKVKLGTREELLVVCGASNLYPGALVPVALPGAKLSRGTIELREFAGIVSQGMLCSREELLLDPALLPQGEGGIAILPAGSPLGEDLAKLLELPDVLLEIKVTANRPDWLSLWGLAREISIFTGYPLSPLKDFDCTEGEQKVEDSLSLADEDISLCKRYIATLIEGVKVAESPLLIKTRLQKCGIRPINNIVDATNYVMLEVGQPLHAFDYHSLQDRKIIVRTASAGEKIVTLDGVERSLQEGMLLITDPSGPIAIAGVMGGLNSEVKEDTGKVVLESALFLPASVRRTSRLLGLKTEASSRFEKGITHFTVETGSERATRLIAFLSGGVICRGKLDVGERREGETITLRPERVNFILSLALSPVEIRSHLERLHFKTVDKGEGLQVEIPPWRTDIKEEADLIEDVARLVGYDAIPSRPLRGAARIGEEPCSRRKWRTWREYLIGAGLQEVLTPPLVPPQFQEFTFLEIKKRGLRLQNPLSPDRSALRLSMLPSLLQVISLNARRGNEVVGIFELGRIYISQGEEELPLEPEILGLAVPLKEEVNWQQERNVFDFFKLKGLLSGLLEAEPIQFVSLSLPHSLHPGRSAEIILRGQRVGIMGEASFELGKFFDLRMRVMLAEVFLSPFLSEKTSLFRPYSRYPQVKRDLAIVVDQQIPYAQVEERIRQVGGECLEKILFFDLYQGEQIPAGKKSLAFSLTFRHPERTLREEEVDELVQEIERKLEGELGGSLRKSLSFR